ncbi:MAG: hypothetical protein AB1806_08430 [Acidobacteriota bacterium]
MPSTSRSCLVAFACAVALAAGLPGEAAAQYRPLPSTYGTGPDVKGESYHIEFAANLWNPPPVFTFTSEGLGIPGTEIDLQADLGIEKRQTYELRLVLRPGTKHKFRFHYLPLRYTADAVLRKDLIFNGIIFPIAIPVQTDFTWTAYRFTYEYDFIHRSRGFGGLLIEAKYADAKLDLTNPISHEFVRARAPIPAIGGVARFYPASFLSVHGEFTYFRLPDSVQVNASLNAVDVDVYATFNITNNFGIQGGWRSTDMGFRIEQDEGTIKLRGPYFGGVVRY